MIVTLIFMDEAGDTGFNFQGGSSRYFVVTIVIFDDPTQAGRVDDAINALRRKLRMAIDQEFRFSPHELHSPASMKICYPPPYRLTQRSFTHWCHEPAL